jgi:hypothetical protein
MYQVMKSQSKKFPGWRIRNVTTRKTYPTVYRTRALAARKVKIMIAFTLKRQRRNRYQI